MKTNNAQIYHFLLLCCLMLMAACTPTQEIDQEQVERVLAQTQQAMTQVAMTREAQKATMASDGSKPVVDTVVPPSEPGATATLTLTPTMTLSPTVTLSPTLDKPMVSVSVNTNCRTGPGKVFNHIGALLVNEQAEVVGKSGDGTYWIIRNPDRAGECWLWGYYASVTGPTDALPVYTPPPTPTPEFSWAGSWTGYTSLFGGTLKSYNMTISVNGQSFSGVMDLSGYDDVTLSGTLSSNQLSVSGTWTSPSDNGTFTFFALGNLQFQGNGKDGSLSPWCGSKTGASMPGTCLKQ